MTEGHAPDRAHHLSGRNGAGADGRGPLSPGKEANRCSCLAGVQTLPLEPAGIWPVASPAKCRQPALPPLSLGPRGQLFGI